MKVVKKISLILLFFVMITALAACANKNDMTASVSNSQNTYDETSAYNSADNTDDNEHATELENETDSEYIKTYTVYAEQGAVVTWYDSQTGQFEYKDKCETCGEVGNIEHSGLSLDDGCSYTAGFTCTNPSCSMWGKNQSAIIGCSVKSERADDF